MNTRKMLIAFLAAVIAPLVAIAAPPKTARAPLSARHAVEPSDRAASIAGDSGEPTRYPLVSYSAPARRELRVAQVEGGNAAAQAAYAPSSYAGHRGQ